MDSSAERRPMNGIWRWFSFLGRVSWLCLILANPGCADPNGTDLRDHSIDVYFPGPNIQSIAESRARNFWAHNSVRFPDTKLLAVQGTTINPGDIQDLYPKLLYSQTGAVTYFAQANVDGSYSELSIFCILIYDTQTGRLVSNEGYAVVDLPPRESVARFGPYVARYIGTGWTW
ncbi:MAG: hypothetical protein JO308_02540 [Verrucomicrobia bacterium]|nr:hypothetical protein [Verrucomicrobiota bacterium]